MKPRFSDMQSKDQEVSIDVDYRILGDKMVVTDFYVYQPNTQDEWTLVTDKKLARELFDKYGLNLIENEIQTNSYNFPYEVVS